MEAEIKNKSFPSCCKQLIALYAVYRLTAADTRGSKEIKKRNFLPTAFPCAHCASVKSASKRH